MTSTQIQSLLVLADQSRPEVARTLKQIEPDLNRWAKSVHVLDINNEPLPNDLKADRALVIGGDGSMISQSRRLVGPCTH